VLGERVGGPVAQPVRRHAWEAVLPRAEQAAYQRVGFGERTSLGERPAVLVIDAQYRLLGRTPGHPSVADYPVPFKKLISH